MRPVARANSSDMVPPTGAQASVACALVQVVVSVLLTMIVCVGSTRITPLELRGTKEGMRLIPL